MEVAVGNIIEFTVPRYGRLLGEVRCFNPVGNVVHLKILGAFPAHWHDEVLSWWTIKNWSINLTRSVPKLPYSKIFDSTEVLAMHIAMAQVQHRRDFPYPERSLAALIKDL